MSQENKSSDVFITLPTTHNESLKDLKWLICIDISGSTENPVNNTNVLKSEIKFVNHIVRKLNPNNNSTKFVMWDDSAMLFDYINIKNLRPSDGTSPASIFKDKNILKCIKEANALMIITDGHIGQHEVSKFAESMLKHGCHFNAVVGMIIGTNPQIKPEDVDVSVLMPSMLSNSCILYQKALEDHEILHTRVMWSSGSFKKLLNPVDIEKNITWNQVTYIDTCQLIQSHNDNSTLTFTTNKLMNVLVDCCDPRRVQEMHNSGYIPLGMNIFFNPDNLLKYEPTFEELKQYSFDRICTHFKITNKYKLLVDWFKIQMSRLVNKILVDNDDDKINFEILVNKMTHGKEARHGREIDPNTSSFIKARNQTIARRYIASDDDIEFALDDLRAVELLQYFRNMMKIMNEDSQMSDRNADFLYSASSMSTTRYSNFSSRSDFDNSVHQTPLKIKATFDNPVLWNQQFLKVCKNYTETNQDCTICCESSIPFILLRKKIKYSRVSEINMNPFEYYSPEIYCNKCADFFCLRGMDPVNVACIGTFPLIILDKIDEESRKHYLKCFSNFLNVIITNQKPTIILPRRGVKRMITDSMYNTVMTPVTGLLYYTGISGLYNSLTNKIGSSCEEVSKLINNDEEEKIDPTKINFQVQYNKIYIVLDVLAEIIKHKILTNLEELKKHNADISDCVIVLTFIDAYAKSLKKYIHE